MTSFVDPDILKFIDKNPLDKRLAVSTKLLTEHSDRIPVIVGRAKLNETPLIKKNKFMVPGDFTFGKFIFDVRQHIAGIDSNSALFFFVSNNILPNNSALMNDLYTKYKSSDGFMYITYACENTFG